MVLIFLFLLFASLAQAGGAQSAEEKNSSCASGDDSPSARPLEAFEGARRLREMARLSRDTFSIQEEHKQLWALAHNHTEYNVRFLWKNLDDSLVKMSIKIRTFPEILKYRSAFFVRQWASWIWTWINIFLKQKHCLVYGMNPVYSA
jgi:hypothetical protein